MRTSLTLMILLFTISACSQPASEANLALHKQASASQEMFLAHAWLSVDGETGSGWSPGGNLPQWIEVDLGRAASVNTIRLLVNQPGGGVSHHRLWVAGEDHAYKQVTEFNEDLHTGDWLIYAPDQALQGIRFVKVETLEGAGWVGWLEVQVWGQP